MNDEPKSPLDIAYRAGIEAARSGQSLPRGSPGHMTPTELMKMLGWFDGALASLPPEKEP